MVGDAPKSLFTWCSAGAATRSVNQAVETWKSFDCGHSSEVVWPEPKRRHNTQIWSSYFAEKRHQFCSPAKCWVSPRLQSSESNIAELNGLQRLWVCITHLIVFNIIFLWGLSSFILSARRVNSFPVAACWWSSFKSTDKHRPQTGRREVTSYPLCSSFSEAALYKCWVWTDNVTVYEQRTLHWGSALMDLYTLSIHKESSGHRPEMVPNLCFKHIKTHVAGVQTFLNLNVSRF